MYFTVFFGCTEPSRRWHLKIQKNPITIKPWNQMWCITLKTTKLNSNILMTISKVPSLLRNKKREKKNQTRWGEKNTFKFFSQGFLNHYSWLFWKCLISIMFREGNDLRLFVLWVCVVFSFVWVFLVLFWVFLAVLEQSSLSKIKEVLLLLSDKVFSLSLLS